MNISNSSISSQYGATLSVLRNANKQPELALQLIENSLERAPAAETVQAAPHRLSSSAQTGTGLIIDIRV